MNLVFISLHFDNNLGQKKRTVCIITKFISLHTTALLSVTLFKGTKCFNLFSKHNNLYHSVSLNAECLRMAVLYSVQSQLHLWYTVVISCLYGLDTPVPFILQICNIVLCHSCMENMRSGYKIWLENLKGKDYFKNRHAYGTVIL